MSEVQTRGLGRGLEPGERGPPTKPGVNGGLGRRNSRGHRTTGGTDTMGVGGL